MNKKELINEKTYEEYDEAVQIINYLDTTYTNEEELLNIFLNLITNKVKNTKVTSEYNKIKINSKLMKKILKVLECHTLYKLNDIKNIKNIKAMIINAEEDIEMHVKQYNKNVENNLVGPIVKKILEEKLCNDNLTNYLRIAAEELNCDFIYIRHIIYSKYKDCHLNRYQDEIDIVKFLIKYNETSNHNEKLQVEYSSLKSKFIKQSTENNGKAKFIANKAFDVKTVLKKVDYFGIANEKETEKLTNIFDEFCKEIREEIFVYNNNIDDLKKEQNTTSKLKEHMTLLNNFKNLSEQEKNKVIGYFYNYTSEEKNKILNSDKTKIEKEEMLLELEKLRSEIKSKFSETYANKKNRMKHSLYYELLEYYKENKKINLFKIMENYKSKIGLKTFIDYYNNYITPINKEEIEFLKLLNIINKIYSAFLVKELYKVENERNNIRESYTMYMNNLNLPSYIQEDILKTNMHLHYSINFIDMYLYNYYPSITNMLDLENKLLGYANVVKNPEGDNKNIQIEFFKTLAYNLKKFKFTEETTRKIATAYEWDYDEFYNKLLEHLDDTKKMIDSNKQTSIKKQKTSTPKSKELLEQFVVYYDEKNNEKQIKFVQKLIIKKNEQGLYCIEVSKYNSLIRYINSNKNLMAELKKESLINKLKLIFSKIEEKVKIENIKLRNEMSKEKFQKELMELYKYNTDDLESLKTCENNLNTRLKYFTNELRSSEMYTNFCIKLLQYKLSKVKSKIIYLETNSTLNNMLEEYKQTGIISLISIYNCNRKYTFFEQLYEIVEITTKHNINNPNIDFYNQLHAEMSNFYEKATKIEKQTIQFRMSEKEAEIYLKKKGYNQSEIAEYIKLVNSMNKYKDYNSYIIELVIDIENKKRNKVNLKSKF